nr:DUF2690 domain-containing protein [Streptomyces sp. HNM0574]
MAGGLVLAVLGAGVGGLASGYFENLFSSDDPPPAASSGQSGGAKPECRGAGCEGRDAQEYLCDDDRILAEKSRPIRLQLKYSPKCRAGWGKILEGGKGDTVTVTTSGGRTEEATISFGHDHHTPMVRAGDTFRLTACAVPAATDGAPPWQKFCVRADERDVQ